MLGAGFMKINNNFIDLFGNKIRKTLYQYLIQKLMKIRLKIMMYCRKNEQNS